MSRFLLLLLLLSLSVLPIEARTNEWTIEIHSQRKENDFISDSAKLCSLYKTRVAYKPTGTEEFRDYEQLWFGVHGKPYGLERTTALQIPPGEESAIHLVTSNSPDADEIMASIDTMLRVWLDCRLIGSNVTTIMVPDRAFDTACNHMLQRWHFYEAGTTVDQHYHSGVILLIKSEANRKRYLAHD